MNTTQRTKDTLCRLADHLLGARARLVDDWRERAKHDELLTSLNTLARKEFLDHIPHILDVLDQQMRFYCLDTPPSLEKRKIERMEVHGLSRWRQGFSITEVVRDWNHLRCAILEEISRAVEKNPDWIQDAFTEAISILADLISEGVNESVATFEEIRQAEARSRVLDLKATISELQQLIESQSKRHRETCHDLRGHLGILASLTNAIKKNSSLEDSLQTLYEPLEDGLNQSLDLLESLRLHSALEANQEKPEVTTFNASDTIRRTLKPYQLLAQGSGIDFRTEGPDTLLAESDPCKFARILQNLMHNALKFTEDGEVSVKWGPARANRHWIVRIQNAGTLVPSRSAIPIGRKMANASHVSPETGADGAIDTVGDPIKPAIDGEQTESHVASDSRQRSGGEGIGLSIAKRLSELLGGRLSLDSDTDSSGFAATLYLPLSPNTHRDKT